MNYDKLRKYVVLRSEFLWVSETVVNPFQICGDKVMKLPSVSFHLLLNSFLSETYYWMQLDTSCHCDEIWRKQDSIWAHILGSSFGVNSNRSTWWNKFFSQRNWVITKIERTLFKVIHNNIRSTSNGTSYITISQKS